MEDATQTANDYITYQFYIKNEDGKVVVYTVKEQEKYMDTSIEIEALPMYLQEKITVGIFFENEGKLYDFLESYSSWYLLNVWLSYDKISTG